MYYIPFIVFNSHKIGILFFTYGWILTPYVLITHPFVIISWWLNENRCIISQIEYMYFERTFLGNGPKYYVPRRQRYLTYSNFIIGCVYHLLYKDPNL